MTSPLVQTNVTVARNLARAARTASAGFASRLLRAAGVELSAVTPAVGAQAEQTLRARVTSAPKSVVAAGVTFAFARLVNVCDTVLGVAAIAEQTDSVSLSEALVRFTAGPLTLAIAAISAKIQSFESLPSSMGLGGLGALSDWVRAAAVVAFLSGGGVVFGAALLIFAQMVDVIDGVDSEATTLAAKACEQLRLSTGQPCTPALFREFVERERAREEANSLTNLAASAASRVAQETAKGFGGALFWIALIGGVGAMLYFTAPALADRAASTAQRFRS